MLAQALRMVRGMRSQNKSGLLGSLNELEALLILMQKKPEGSKKRPTAVAHYNNDNRPDDVITAIQNAVAAACAEVWNGNRTAKEYVENMLHPTGREESAYLIPRVIAMGLARRYADPSVSCGAIASSFNRLASGTVANAVEKFATIEDGSAGYPVDWKIVIRKSEEAVKVYLATNPKGVHCAKREVDLQLKLRLNPASVEAVG